MNMNDNDMNISKKQEGAVVHHYHLSLTADQVKRMLHPHELWIMRIQSLLVWESPIFSTIFILIFNFLFWLFAISYYRFFHVLGCCIIIVFISHSWMTKIWPEIKVPAHEEDMNEGWTYIHPTLLNMSELSEIIAKYLSILCLYDERFCSLRKNKPGKFCLYCSMVLICGINVGWFISGHILVYIPAIGILLWPGIWYNNLLVRIYLKFEPLFAQPNRSRAIERSHRVHQEDSDTDLDGFIPRDFKPTVDCDRLCANFESGGSSFSSRNASPFEPEIERKISFGQFASPDLDPITNPSDLNINESNMSLLPTIPSLDDLDQSASWVGPSLTQDEKRRENIDFSNSESDDNMEESLSIDLDVPDLRNLPIDDATTSNYLAAETVQTLSQMGVVGAIGLRRIVSYINGDNKLNAVEIDEIFEDEPENCKKGNTRVAITGDFEFIEHDDIPMSND